VADSFPGFSTAAVEFLDGLRKCNTRDYFAAHRPIYLEHVLSPVRLLVTEVGQELRARVSRGIRSDPRTGRSLFRMNRDLRFSKDRTPYHPWVDAIWWEGGDAARELPAFMFRFASDHLIVGAGIMGMRDRTLSRYRRAVDDDMQGQSLLGALGAVMAASDTIQVSTPMRKRAPAPYRDDHPRRDLLCLDSVHAWERLDLPAELGTSSFTGWLATRHARLAPLHRWLVANLTEPAEGEQRGEHAARI
jgi:uncharacterized protein (TIGR02453 family)